MTLHIYKEEMAQGIADRIKKLYVKELEDLLTQMGDKDQFSL